MMNLSARVGEGPVSPVRRRLLKSTILGGAGIALARLTPAAVAQEGPPDILLVNGQFHTMDDANTIVEAVAIRGNAIQAVGDVPEAGPGTRVIDLGGKTVVPGIIEPHIHVVSLYNRPGYHTILENTRNLAEIQDALRARRADVPEGGWVTSLGGFHPNQWSDITEMPTLSQLDEAVPDRPVFLYTRFTGPAATNSMGKALFDEWDSNPPLPHPDLAPVAVGEDGLIPGGGFGQVTPATAALYHLRSIATLEDHIRTAAETQAYSASVGLTSMSDKVLFPTPGPLHPRQVLSNLDHYRMYDPLLELDRRGDAINRVEINFLHHQGFIEALGDMENQLPELRERLRNQWRDFGTDHVWVGGIGEWAAPVNVDISTPGGQVWLEAQKLVAEAGWRNENSVDSPDKAEGALDAWEALAGRAELAIANKHYILHHADAITADQLAGQKR
jgi:predicted amidohydrolase YtcJ